MCACMNTYATDAHKFMKAHMPDPAYTSPCISMHVTTAAVPELHAIAVVPLPSCCSPAGSPKDTAGSAGHSSDASPAPAAAAAASPGGSCVGSNRCTLQTHNTQHITDGHGSSQAGRKHHSVVTGSWQLVAKPDSESMAAQASCALWQLLVTAVRRTFCLSAARTGAPAG